MISSSHLLQKENQDGIKLALIAIFYPKKKTKNKNRTICLILR